MPTRYSVTIQAKGQPSGTRVQGQFDDDEWERLTAFSRYAHELRGARLRGRDPPWSFAFSFGSDTGYRAELPDKTEVRDLAMLLRPFILENEPTAFYRVVNLLSKHFRDEPFQIVFRAWRDRFSGKDGQRLFTFEFGELVLNSEAALNLWLNAYEFHRDPDKRAILEQIKQEVPFEMAEGIFVEMLCCQAEAVLLAARFVDQIASAPSATRR